MHNPGEGVGMTGSSRNRASLLITVTGGRPGRFFAGCCAGRPTASRSGLWSSDRVLAVRRIPVQLWEAATALLIGVDHTRRRA